MNEHDLVGRLNKLKKEVQTLWSKLTDGDFELNRTSKKAETQNDDNDIKKVKFADDVLHIDDDENSNDSKIKYYTTENSPPANGAEKEAPQGIDRFGKQEEVIPGIDKQH